MDNTQAVLSLSTTHLRLGADCQVEKLVVDESFWPRLMSGELGDFHNEYLVCSLSYDKDWEIWEMHPNGDEIVVLLSGAVDFIVETDAGIEETFAVRNTGDVVIVPQACWHTANVLETSTMLFITPGEGTEGRSRIL